MTLTSFIIVLIGVSLALSVGMSVAWYAWRETGNSGWVDTVWTFAVGLTGTGAALLAAPGLGEFTGRQWLVVAFATVWAARLGGHIALRTKGIKDDPRYAKLTEGWGGDARRQMFILLQKQALVSIPLVFAMALAAWNPLPLRVQDYLAVLVFAVAIIGEAAADSQLRSFGRAPETKGKVCDVGLWHYSRHPNFFFQWLGWTAYVLLAVDVTGTFDWGWVSLAAPACIYWLLVHVSGIPPLEEHMLETCGDAFRAYQARTNAFFPAPPRTN